MNTKPQMDRRFPPTHWSLVGRAADRHTDAGFNALGELIQTYRAALVAHLIRARQFPALQAEDIVQAFITDKLLLGDLLATSDRTRGRFRNYILTALDRFAISQIRRDQAQRRLPEGGVVSLDNLQELAETADLPPPGTAFDVAWAQVVIDETLRQVRERCQATGRAGHWDLFYDRVVNPILHQAPPRPYDVIARSMGFPSPVQAANALITVKRMFERTMRRVIRAYVATENAVDEELKDLMRIVSEAG